MFDTIDGTAIAPGFDDPAAGAQTSFRAALAALSRPGTVVPCGTGLTAPAPLNAASAAVLLALSDFETPVWLDAALMDSPARAWLRFHASVPLVAKADEAAFAVFGETTSMAPLTHFSQGTEDYPDRAATVIVQVAGLLAGEGRRLSGPGIDGETRLSVHGLPDAFWTQWSANNRLFPRGVDVLLTSGDALAALPRTTVVED